MSLHRPSVRRQLLLLSAAAALAGCSNDPLAVEIPAPGEPSSIVLTEVAVAGGHESRRETRIDSASKRFVMRRCETAPIGVSCTTFLVELEGDVVAPSVESLFLDTKASAFRALKAEYPRPGSIVPPDVAGATLEITRDGFRRSIVWDATATLPGALANFICSVQAARGSLISCAN